MRTRSPLLKVGCMLSEVIATKKTSFREKMSNMRRKKEKTREERRKDVFSTPVIVLYSIIFSLILLFKKRLLYPFLK
ncbi:MAG: hypothetical protein ACXQTS_07425 [Candidatus Methanospirareceae archaeon]